MVSYLRALVEWYERSVSSRSPDRCRATNGVSIQSSQLRLLTDFDIKQQPYVLQTGRVEVSQEVQQSRHVFMRRLQCPQLAELIPATVD